MIIRRRHTKNFTTIGNELFEDDRLAADEVGILAYLLSRPDDWEVRRPALMRRWHIGRDALRRIIHNLMRTGWCQAERTRLSNGTFHTIYEIRDEPGPTLTDDEVKDALSLVSGDAPETGHPDTGHPDTGEPDTANPTWPIKSLPNTDSQNPESYQLEGMPVWADLQKLWPTDEILSPLICEKSFAALPPKDRQWAIQSAPQYLASCRAKNRKVCDLSTFLRERRFEMVRAVQLTDHVIIKGGTPQSARWVEYWDATGAPEKFKREQLAAGRTITMPTEWPPGIPKATGPPDAPRMLPDDEDELAKNWG